MHSVKYIETPYNQVKLQMMGVSDTIACHVDLYKHYISCNPIYILLFNIDRYYSNIRTSKRRTRIHP